MKFFPAATLALLACACQQQESKASAKQAVAAQPLEQQLTDSLRKLMTAYKVKSSWAAR